MLEQIYSDFTTKLLPSIQSGLAITKDYFIELFGRYIKYLIITDIISIVECTLLIVTGVVIYKYTKKSWDDRKSWADSSWSNDRAPEVFGFIISVVLTVVGTIGVFHNINKLAMSIYVPEIRVYEEITDYQNRPSNNTSK